LKTLLFATLLVLASCEKPQESAFSSRENASTGTDIPSSWNPSVFPLKINISDSFNNSEDQAIRDMANAWSDSIDNNVQFMDANYYTQEKNSSLSGYEDSLIGVYKLEQWPSTLPATALAVTQIIGIRKSGYIEITHADILVNYQNYSFTTDNTWGYDLQTIILHEMGHLLGLYHDNSSISESVMYPTISRYSDNRAPREADIKKIEEKYSIDRSAHNSRYLAGNFETSQVIDDDSDKVHEEKVVIQFEIMADGSEEHFIKVLE